MPYTSSTKVRSRLVLMGMCSYGTSHGGQAMWQAGVTLLPQRHPGETGTCLHKEICSKMPKAVPSVKISNWLGMEADACHPNTLVKSETSLGYVVNSILKNKETNKRSPNWKSGRWLQLWQRSVTQDVPAGFMSTWHKLASCGKRLESQLRKCPHQMVWW